MTASMKTILVLGGTSGIGEAFARRFHSQGKRVVVVGRRQERLDSLKAELPGAKGYRMDMTDFPALPGHVEHLMATYPDINTVWVNAGVMEVSSLVDKASTSDARIQADIASNVIAPTLIARHFLSHLVAQDAEANFMITSSGTAFVPVGMFAVYSSSKAYVHSLCVGLRQQLASSKVNVIEIVPPLVETGMGNQGDNSVAKKFPSMPLKDYVDETFAVLDNTPAKDLKEVSAGTGLLRVKGWRDGLGPLLESMKLGG